MKNVFNNTYGLARSVIAIGNLLTFALTDFTFFFEKESFQAKPFGIVPNFFYILGENGIIYSQVISVIILLWVISGYLPQITGILHAWLIYSFSTFSILIEGGDQISQIILILLIPVTLFDKRINHWFSVDYFQFKRADFFTEFSYSCLFMIRIQMCVLYFFAFVEKFRGPEWRDGSAFYYWYNNHPFGANIFIHKILDPLINYKISYIFITWGVLLLEITLFSSIFMAQKNRRTLFYFAATFHFMIWIIHGLASFYLAMLGGLIIYLLPVDSSIDFNLILLNLKQKGKFIIRSLNIKKQFISFFLCVIIFCSCDKDDPIAVDDTHAIVMDSTFIISKDLYLWNSQIIKQTDFDPLLFQTPMDLLLEFRKYSPKDDNGFPVDKWSFAIEKERWDDILKGNALDFGCSFRFNAEDDLRISEVNLNSFADNNGLYRGLQVLSINGIKALSSNIELLSSELNKSENLSISYLDKETQSNKNITIPKALYTVEPIVANSYFTVNDKKLGYINIATFINSVNNKLPLIFDDFKANNIEALIIDLRYNGGGLTNIMEEIANRLIPSSAVGKTMYITRHNANYAMFDSTTFFSESNQRLDLRILYFIVGHSTASSSEMLINALKPYVNTVLIGQETQGKLVGMYTLPFYNYILAPISFKTYNANEESLEKKGFIPNYYQDDDVTNDFNENEGCISTALYHYKNNSFPSSQKKSKKENKKESLIVNGPTMSFAVKGRKF